MLNYEADFQPAFVNNRVSLLQKSCGDLESIIGYPWTKINLLRKTSLPDGVVFRSRSVLTSIVNYGLTHGLRWICLNQFIGFKEKHREAHQKFTFTPDIGTIRNLFRHLNLRVMCCLEWKTFKWLNLCWRKLRSKPPKIYRIRI